MYSPTSSLTDPPAHNPIANGVAWVQNVALGSVATSVAVVAVAAIGLLMLSGRLELRRGITAVLGCFILFGAASIGSAIMGRSTAGMTPIAVTSPLRNTMPREPTPTGHPRTTYDPYAGASAPFNR